MTREEGANERLAPSGQDLAPQQLVLAPCPHHTWGGEKGCCWALGPEERKPAPLCLRCQGGRLSADPGASSPLGVRGGFPGKPDSLVGLPQPFSGPAHPRRSDRKPHPLVLHFCDTCWEAPCSVRWPCWGLLNPEPSVGLPALCQQAAPNESTQLLSACWPVSPQECAWVSREQPNPSPAAEGKGQLVAVHEDSQAGVLEPGLELPPTAGAGAGGKDWAGSGTLWFPSC